MEKYTARINHSEETIKAMARTQFECFKGKSYYITFVVCLGLLAAAIFWKGIPQGVQILFLAVGCFTLIGLNSPPKKLAEQVIKNLKGKFPKMGYVFSADSVQLTGADEDAELKYKDILLLVEDRNYLYIFIQNRSAYMIDTSSVKPDAAGFKAFLEKKTGLHWTRTGSNPLHKAIKNLRVERTVTRL